MRDVRDNPLDDRPVGDRTTDDLDPVPLLDNAIVAKRADPRVSEAIISKQASNEAPPDLAGSAGYKDQHSIPPGRHLIRLMSVRQRPLIVQIGQILRKRPCPGACGAAINLPATFAFPSRLV